jgi:gliding motility-associated-like protein
MSLKRLFYFLALLLALPVAGFGQTVPVAPSMLFNLGTYGGWISPNSSKFDAQGNMYISGKFFSLIDFDPSADALNARSVNSQAFVAKYSATGALAWVKVLEDYIFAFDINGFDIDRNGNVSVIGSHHNLITDAFIWRLDKDGNDLWYKEIISGHVNRQTGYKVASDDAGNLIAVFTFQGSPDVDGNITAKGTADGLVVKYDPNGNVIWKFSLGATGVNNYAVEALVDKDNNIIIAGYTTGTVNYNPLGAPVNVTANHSIFLAKYSPAGILQWVKSIKGLGDYYNITLALDGQDNIYLNGSFNDPLDFGVAPTLTPNGSQDIFIAKYSSGGNLLYHKNMGGTGAQVLNRGMVAGPDNSLYLTGSVKGKADFDPSTSAAEVNTNGAVSMFLAKYDNNGNYQWVFGIPGFGKAIDQLDLYYISDISYGHDDDALQFASRYVNVNSNNEIFLTGKFGSTVNFDGTGCGISNLTAQGGADMFMVRYTPTTLMPVTNNSLTAPTLNAICPGDDPGLIIGATPNGNFDSYQWQQSLDNIAFTDISGAVSKDYDPPVVTTTTYYRRRVIKSVCGVPNFSNVVTVTLAKPVTVNTITAPAAISFCNAGDAGLIRGSAPQANGNVEYQWQQSTDNVSFTDISGANAKEYDPPSAGITTYYRRLITDAPCSIAIPGNTVTITVTPLPVATVSAGQTIYPGESVTLNASGGSVYSWSPATGLSSAGSASPVASPNVTTTYSVTISNGNCSTTLTVKVNVVTNVGAQIVIPNTFTPNGDGTNDTWNISGLNSYKQGVLTVFNRNGQQVFKSTAYPTPWDGTRNGKPLPPGTYYYVIQLNDGQKPRSGSITLLK